MTHPDAVGLLREARNWLDIARDVMLGHRKPDSIKMFDPIIARLDDSIATLSAPQAAPAAPANIEGALDWFENHVPAISTSAAHGKVLAAEVKRLRSRVPAAPQAAPPAHGGRPMTLQECADAEGGGEAAPPEDGELLAEAVTMLRVLGEETVLAGYPSARLRSAQPAQVDRALLRGALLLARGRFDTITLATSCPTARSIAGTGLVSIDAALAAGETPT